MQQTSVRSQMESTRTSSQTTGMCHFWRSQCPFSFLNRQLLSLDYEPSNPLRRSPAGLTAASLEIQVIRCSTQFRTSEITQDFTDSSTFLMKQLVNLREYSDELWRQQLWPQRSDFSNVAQKSQHVSVKFLLVWKLLQPSHTRFVAENTGEGQFIPEDAQH